MPFSTSKRIHCTLVACDPEWVTVALHCVFWISTKVVYLQCSFGCYMAGVMWNCRHLSAHSVYTIQPRTSLQLYSKRYIYINTHTHRMHVLNCNLPTALLEKWPSFFTWHSSLYEVWHKTCVLTLPKAWQSSQSLWVAITATVTLNCVSVQPVPLFITHKNLISKLKKFFF